MPKFHQQIYIYPTVSEGAVSMSRYINLFCQIYSMIIEIYCNLARGKFLHNIMTFVNYIFAKPRLEWNTSCSRNLTKMLSKLHIGKKNWRLTSFPPPWWSEHLCHYDQPQKVGGGSLHQVEPIGCRGQILENNS